MPSAEPGFIAVGERVAIRAPRQDDQDAFVAAMRRSFSLHQPWLSAPSDAAAYRRYLARLLLPTEAGFLVLRRADDALCGVVNLNVITYESLCSAYTSYYATAATAGRGYMTDGMRLVIAHAFGPLGLHRLEANIQPGNRRSIEFVRSIGFRLEGFSPRYLRINGQWRDHERWALLSDEAEAEAEDEDEAHDD